MAKAKKVKNPYLVDRLSFQEVIELESNVPGMYYRRCDYKAKWCFRFDPDNAAKLTQYPDGGKPSSNGDWYHHDFMDGIYKVSEPKKTKA